MEYEEIKQAIIVRTDLKMGKGKLVAQCAHASLMSYITALKYDKEIVNEWLECGQKKIVLKIGSEKEIDNLYESFRRMRVPCALVVDAGLTQLEPNTKTALGVGPWKSADIDKLLSKLKLL